MASFWLTDLGFLIYMALYLGLPVLFVYALWRCATPRPWDVRVVNKRDDDPLSRGKG